MCDVCCVMCDVWCVMCDVWCEKIVLDVLQVMTLVDTSIAMRDLSYAPYRYTVAP
jgi:hypothetical protein